MRSFFRRLLCTLKVYPSGPTLPSFNPWDWGSHFLPQAAFVTSSSQEIADSSEKLLSQDGRECHTPQVNCLHGEKGSQGMQPEHTVQLYIHQKCSHMLPRVKWINRWSLIHSLQKLSYTSSNLLISDSNIFHLLFIGRWLCLLASRSRPPVLCSLPPQCCLHAGSERKESWCSIKRDIALRTNWNPFCCFVKLF